MNGERRTRLAVTEGILREGGQVSKLEPLRTWNGARVAIDDFGIPYFSLSRLPKLPIDTLKFDRSFSSWGFTGMAGASSRRVT